MKKSVVLIDDDMEMVDLIANFFKRFKDIKIDKFYDPVRGLEFVKSNNVDLIVTDITMPKMDGIELLQKIKEIKPSTYVIMITAEPSLNRVLKSHKYDACDFYIKPLKLAEIEKKVIELGFIKCSH